MGANLMTSSTAARKHHHEMKTVTNLLIFLSFSGFSAHAQQPRSFDVGYFKMSTPVLVGEFQGDDMVWDPDMGTIGARYTHGLTSWLTIEGTLSLGVRDDTLGVASGGDTVSFTLASEQSVMLNAKFHYPIADRLSLHGLIGGHSTELSLSGTAHSEGGVSDSDSDSESFSGGVIGAGAEYRLPGNVWALRGDLLNLQISEDDGDDLRLIGLSLSRKF